MQYNLMIKLGLENIDISYIFLTIIIITLLIISILIFQIISLRKLKTRYEKFMLGNSAKSLEEDIINLTENNKYFKEELKKQKEDINNIYEILEKCIKKVGIIKYDAFKQMGGQLSYCIALLDDKNDGIIINSVHSTEGCYSYSKKIRKGKSSIPLGEEEQQALIEAIESSK